MRPSPAAELLEAVIADADAGVGVALVDGDLRYRAVNARMAEINGVPVEAHAGRPVAEVLPDMTETIEPLLRRVLDTGEPVVATMLGGRTDAAADRHWQVSYLAVETSEGRHVGAVVIDVTERVRAAQQAEARHAQQAVVADLGRAALRGMAVEDLLDLACLRVRDELGADLSGVMFLTSPGDALVMRAGAGWPAAAMGNVFGTLGRGSQAGYCLQTGAPVVMRDAASETRFEVSAAMHAAGVRSAISTPIDGETSPVGVLGVLARSPARFDDDDAAFLRAVAQLVGAALQRDDQRRRVEALATQRGRLVAQAVEAAEREQRRIAGVLQDDVLQHLLSARLELSGGDADALERVRASLDRATELVQGLTGSLDPVSLAHAGLRTAVERVAADHTARGGVRIDVDVAPDAEGRADSVVLSLVRELLTNVVRHAEATTARVAVTPSDGRGVRVSVADDGCGLPDGAAEGGARNGLGLAYARERVEALGGSVTFAPGTDGRGTAVTAVFPV